MKKLPFETVKRIRSLIDQGEPIFKISNKLDIDKKLVNEIYRSYREEQIANSPRLILSKKIYQLQKAANKAIKNYRSNTRPEYAYAISSISGELRECIKDLQGLLDVYTLSNKFLDEVLYPNMIDCLQVFVKNLGETRDEISMQLEPVEAKLVNNILLDLIKDMKGKLNDIRLKGIQRLETAMEIDMDDRRNELLSLPDKPKLKLYKKSA